MQQCCEASLTLVQCFEDDTPYNYLGVCFKFSIFKSCCNFIVQNSTWQCFGIRQLALLRRPSTHASRGDAVVPISAGWFLIPSNVLLPHPLSWRTEPLEQNLRRSLQAWTVPPLTHARDNRVHQNGIWELPSTATTLLSFPVEGVQPPQHRFGARNV